MLKNVYIAGNPVRLIVNENDNEPFLVAQDLGKALGYRQGRYAARRYVSDENISYRMIDAKGGPKKYLVINEVGMYEMILNSMSKESQNLKKWVTKEVLPSLRRNGIYQINKTTEPKTLTEALTMALELSKQEDKQQLTTSGIFTLSNNLETASVEI